MSCFGAVCCSVDKWVSLLCVLSLLFTTGIWRTGETSMQLNRIMKRCIVSTFFLYTIFYFLRYVFHGDHEGEVHQDTPKQLPKIHNAKTEMTIKRMLNLQQTVKLAQEYITASQNYRKALNTQTVCIRYMNESLAKKKTFWRVWTDDDTPPSDITLVTVTTVGRLNVLDKALANWPGPVSLTIYLGESDLPVFLNAVKKYFNILEKRFIELSVVTGVYEFLPVNWMRQVALQQTKTSHVILLDADFIPSVNLYKHLKLLQKNYKDQPKVLVIPAFELLHKKKGFTFPKTKSELISLWDDGIVQPFHIDHKFAQRATNIKKWRKVQTIYPINYQLYFEPYIFAEKKILPNYDVRFLGRYDNKNSYFCEIGLYGIAFEVMPNDFIIHYPHPHTPVQDYRRCAIKLMSRCTTTMDRMSRFKKKNTNSSYKENLKWLKLQSLFLTPIVELS